MMPKISGFEVCKRVRADPSPAILPCSCITALDQPSDIDRAIQAGTDDFLTKPINKSETPVALPFPVGAAGNTSTIGPRPRIH